VEYSNPELPEGINTSKSHPLKEFAILTFGLLGLIILVLTATIVVVDNFADKIPFEVEQKLPVTSLLNINNTERLPPYLNTLTRKVVNSVNLPVGMHITFHYVNDDTVNAFATLGGNIVLYRGLIEKLQNENELSMVIAHEIAHIKYRHPILSTTHGIVVGIALTALSSTVGNSVVNSLIGSTGDATLMRFSRDFEYQADRDAIKSLVALYGDAGGALGLFRILAQEDTKASPFEFLATHPLTENRLQQAEKMNARLSTGHKNTVIEYPQDFRSWLTRQHSKSHDQ